MAELDGGSYLWSFYDAIFKRLGCSIFKDYLCRVKLETLVEKLESSLESIKQVFDDAEIKQYENPMVKKWVGDVKHAMYEADQLFDEISTDEELKKSKLSTSSMIFSPLPNNPFKSRIQELLKSLDSLALKTDTLGLKKRTCASNKVVLGPKSSERLPTTSLVDESGICGRDGDKDEIINFLLDSDSGKKENDKKEIIDLSILSDDDEENASDNQGPAVISIVGLGGMGKTTLAQHVYNHPVIKKQFELKGWVYVSETFDVIALTKAILGEFGFPADSGSLNLLQHQLQQGLRRKRYLLVLDDVWNENDECLELLLRPFNRTSSKSKIVVTTRKKDVARSIVLKPNKIHDLKPLDESYCWELFKRHAFHGRSVSEYQSLESVGKTLVDKCRGLPLAVKTLGNLLRKKISRREWDKILDTDLWRVWEGDINFNPILRLGYHNLHANLKRCFAYCSIFYKGYRFTKDEVIKLWMADGLLSDTDKKEEEVGSKFFYDLESISFFQESENSLYFVMHDLVNDLAKLVSGEFCLQIDIDGVQDIHERTRHISSFPGRGDRRISLDQIYKIKGLRSLKVNDKAFNCAIVQHDLFSRLKYLRMLSFSGCDLKELSDEISNLKLLRYLDLSATGIKRLPDSICMLYNLQTLILRYCELTELPSDFYKLVNLRHLNLEDTGIKKMPKQIGRLNHLQTLTHFVVGEQSGFDIKELEKLNLLEGKLQISGLENVIDPRDTTKANLKDKKNLESLVITYNNGNGETESSITEREVVVLEALQPNRNLNKLKIQNYRGSRLPNWLEDSQLPNLETLVLFSCKLCSLPSHVPFMCLQILTFYDISEWKEWLC